MARKAQERLGEVLSAKVSPSEREAMRELADHYGKSESEILRDMVKLVVKAYRDIKEQAATGAPAEEILERSARLALLNLTGVLSPAELRQVAVRLAEAANKLADLLERSGASEASRAAGGGKGG